MEKSNFDKLLERYLTDEVTEQERIKIEAWLKVIQEENNANATLDKETEEKLFRNIVDKHADLQGLSIKKLSGRKDNKWVLKIAAVFVMTVLASFVAWQFIQRGGNGAVASAGEKSKKLKLNDGTLIWLKGQSSIIYYEKQDQGQSTRYSELRGEGLFEVAKEASRPFLIRCGDVTIKVLGTSFNVKSYRDTVEVSVFTGKVNVASGSSTIDATRYEKIICYGNGEFTKTFVTKTDEELITLHTQYMMAFNDAPMSVIIERLSKKFDVNFAVQNQKLNSCQITIDLTDRSLEKSLQMIADVLHVDFTRTGKNVTLSGSGCE